MPDEGQEKRAEGNGKPLLEWCAALFGLVLTLAVLGYVGWQAAEAPDAETPAITVEAGAVSQVPGGYVVEVAAINHAAATASAVQVEGSLGGASGEAEISSVTFDYVPGHSERNGGLFFRQDPRLHQLDVRALGYVEP